MGRRPTAARTQSGPQYREQGEAHNNGASDHRSVGVRVKVRVRVSVSVKG